MALTTLDAKPALVVVDLQQGIVAMPTAHPAAQVVTHAAALAEAFRRHGLPVVLVNVAGGAPGRAEQARPTGNFPPGFTDLMPELNRQASDHLVTKRTWGAFTNTDLEAYLREQGVTQIVLAGISTSIGIESTARFAHELGFNIAFAVDAMTDLHLDAHTNSLTRIFPRLGETGTTQQVLAMLEQTRA